MTDDGEDQAAQAFESLRAEVSLMRRAVERLAAERAEVPDVPDYSETLGVISRNLSATAQRVDALVKSPARSEEHTSELQSLMSHLYAVFSLTKKHYITILF